MKKLYFLKSIIELNAYGVCTRLGEKLAMPKREIRLFFIYTSFVTIGSPIILYLILAFWMKLKHSIRAARNPVWDY